MIIVFLDPSDLQEVVPRLLRRLELDLAPVAREGHVQYLLPGGVMLMQSGAGLTLSDDNWPGALHILRELASVAEGEVSFMTDEDELRIGILRRNMVTPDALLADFHVHTGPDLQNFAADIARVMAVSAEEMAPDPHSAAFGWAMDSLVPEPGGADQVADYQITLVVPAPGLRPEVRLDVPALTDQRWFRAGGEQVFAATGQGFFLLLDDITQERGASFLRGVANVLYDPDETLAPDRDAVLGMVRTVCGPVLPFLQIDVDRNGEVADESGYWVVELSWHNGSIRQSDFFWQL